MNFSINFDTVKSGWSIVYIEVSQVIISLQNIPFLSLKIHFVLVAKFFKNTHLDGRLFDSCHCIQLTISSPYFMKNKALYFYAVL